MILITILDFSKRLTFFSYKKNYVTFTLPTYPNLANFKKLTPLQSHLDYLSLTPIKLSFTRVKNSKSFIPTRLRLVTSKSNYFNFKLKLLISKPPYKSVKSSLSFFYKLTHVNRLVKHSFFAQKYYKRLRKRFFNKRKYKLSNRTNQYLSSLYTPLVLQSMVKPQTKNLHLKLKRGAVNLILSHKPLYINYKLMLTYEISYALKYILKKSIFSFLKTNQVKRNIMQRRHKLSSLRFFSKIKSSNSHLKYLLTNYLRYNFNSKLLLSKLSQNKPNNILLKNLFYTSSATTTTYAYFDKKYPSGVHTYSEVTLSRVKFKPGYQRLWRRARLTLAESLNIKYTYQQQFTKYITRFNRKLNGYYFSQYDYALHKVILYSKLLPDYNTFNYLWKSNNVYLNGNLFPSTNYILFEGDVLQVTVSIWMYVYLRWSLMWSSLRLSKFRRLVYRKTLASSYRVMKLRKQRSNYTPLWVYNTRYDISDVKPYLETDFFTLSSVFIFNNYYYDFYTPDEFIDERHYIYRLYNWKYIT